MFDVSRVALVNPNPGVIESLGRALEGLLLPFMARFVAEGSHFAAGLAFALIATASVFLLLYGLFSVLPAWGALAVRQARFRKVLKPAKSDVERRRLFAEYFDTDIDPAMTRANGGFLDRIFVFLGGDSHLRLAWSEFKETFVDDGESAQVIRNTARPQGYFFRAVKNPGRLGGLASLLVSIGLLLTFIGIIAVLLKAGCEMDPSGGYTVCERYQGKIATVEAGLAPASTSVSAEEQAGTSPSPDAVTEDNIQTAVISIVAGAASKFYASIGGLFASIILKVGLGIYAFIMRRGVEGLADKLESGLAFVPEQHLALEQLELVRDQSKQLKTFNTDFAIAIDQALNKALSPVSEQLGGIQSSIESQNEATLGALKEGVGSAVNSMAGGEIRELGRVLGELKTELGGLSGKLNEGGEEAARRMDAASQALETMAGQLEQRFETMNASAEKAATEANTTMLEAAAGINDVLKETLRKLDQSASSNADHLKTVGDKLEALSEGVAASAQTAFADAFAHGAEQTRNAAAEAGRRLTEDISAASSDWRSSLEQATGQLKLLQEALGRTSSAADAQIAAMEKSATSTRQASDMLSGAASDISSAARPVASAVESLRDAAQSMESSTAKLETTVAGALEQAGALAERMSATASAAEEAWSDYKSRFSEVDEELGRALQDVSEAMGKNAEGMRKYVAELDGEMAKAVNSFATATQPLSELSEELNDLVETLQRETSAER